MYVFSIFFFYFIRYFNDVRVGVTASGGTPTILKEKGATAWVDGENLLGSTVSAFSMNLAIEKAREFGIGWVVAKGSNHFSIAGHWAMQESVLQINIQVKQKNTDISIEILLLYYKI